MGSVRTREEIVPVDCHDGQDRLSVTSQIIRKLKALPDLRCAVELALSKLYRYFQPMTYLSHDPDIMVPSEAVCKAQTLCS